MSDNEPQADAIIIDGSALVDVLPPRTSKMFEDYATLDVLPTILVQAYSIEYERRYIIFDVYRPSSLKAEVVSKRGEGGWSQAHGNKQMQSPFKLVQLIEKQ